MISEEQQADATPPEAPVVALDAWSQGRRLSALDVMGLMKQVTESLEKLHEEGRIHGCIAPWNLLWSASTGQLLLSAQAEGFPGDLSSDACSGSLASLVYLAPEQTGMAETVDPRADLYSLGVVAWELLVGRPPFQAEEAQALLHAHLATRPTPPHEHRSEIPLICSEMILKLLAKRPEERYQTARGLKLDLAKALGALKKGEAAHFALDQHDQFLLSLQALPLYGRQRESQQLLDALQDVRQGKMRFLLVRGAPGVGKTSLVRHLEEPAYRSQGHFARGRFAPLQGDIPFLAFQTALRGLLQEILGKETSRRLYWRTRVKHALGEADGVLAPLLPELEHLLGGVSKVVPLPAQEARIRSQKVFLDLIRVLASPPHPLVLFLDDLQWADPASLSLIEFLVTEQELKGLVLVGGFRDDEVEASPLLSRWLEDIEQRSIPVTSLPLKGLASDDLQEMVATLFSCSQERAGSLAQLLWNKTAGNPYFVRVLLLQLYQERLLWTDVDGWSWEEAAIGALAVTDNVVSLLLARLQRQSPEAQEALRCAACLGHRFQPGELAALLGLTPEALHSLLQPCFEQHLLSVEADGGCRFVHDRVQEAAYALMDEGERKATHLKVGLHLLKQNPAFETSQRLYNIIQHLQHGLQGEPDAQERERLVEVARVAGHRARGAGAFESALGFVDWGMHLLGPRRWEEHYEQTLSLACQLVELGQACPQRERVQQVVDEILTHGRTPRDQLPGWNSKILLLVSEHKMLEALEVTDQFFALTGTPLLRPKHPLGLLWHFLRVLWMLRGRQPEELVDLPEVRDPLTWGILDIQEQISLAYLVARIELAPTMVLRTIEGLLRHGWTDHSIRCWIGWGTLLNHFFGLLSLGRRYGELALQLARRTGRPELEVWIRFFKTTAQDCWDLSYGELAQAYRSSVDKALEFGQLPIAFAAYRGQIVCQFFAGHSLSSLDAPVKELKHLFAHYQYQLQQDSIHLLDGYLSLLREPSPRRGDLFLNPIERSSGTHFKLLRPVLQLQAHLVFGQLREAFAVAIEKQDVLDTPISTMYWGPYWGYALPALYHGLEQGWATWWKCRKVLRRGWRQLKRWVKLSPASRQHRLTWAQAAMRRWQGRGFLALELYNQALEQAKSQGFQQDAGLIAEQAASICGAMAPPRMAFLREAQALYEAWGALAKVHQLQERHPTLLEPAPLTKSLPGPDSPSSTTGEQLRVVELESVVQASRALTQERDKEALLHRLMREVMELAAAERGFFLLRRQRAWRLAAQAEGRGEIQTPDLLLSLDRDSPQVSTAMIRYSILTHEPVSLADASQEGPFVRDPYVLSACPRSVLCLPLLFHERLLGLLFLENSLSAGVFTPSRQEFVELLGIQALVGLQVLEPAGDEKEPTWDGASQRATPLAKGRTLDEPLLRASAVPRPALTRDISPVGQEVGDWCVLKEMARGGMSIIYEAIHRATRRRAALKLLRPGSHDQKLRARRFAREARLLGRFNHPHIIALLDFEVDPRFGHFMALEYLEGENLQAIFQRCAPVPLGWWLPVAEQLCQALAVVHEKGILHRDLKPANVFLSPGEPFPHLHLLDFGIADITSVSKETRLTSTGVIVGTPAYLAPEQLKEKESLTKATDLYALGVLWFEALTGKHPLGEGSSAELFVKILQDKPSQLGELRPAFRGSDLELLLDKLLSKNPRSRPQEVALLWNELAMSCQLVEDPMDAPDRYPQLL